ncbi:hypothetical protein ABVF61_19070 [Roseibium sp. HPY-6]|uniref:hypothetical protein n=1 Tax=Roseibium sp. HPY-6 TaxID=3229852 RepID=UPI00338E7855
MEKEDKTAGSEYKTLTLDVDYYQSFLDDVDISDAQKRELIETLWNIVVQFVDLGFGIHPLQQANPTKGSESQEALAKFIKDFADEELSAEKESILEGVDE